MAALLWVLLCFPATVCSVTLPLQGETFCEWLSVFANQANWRSVSRFTDTRHIFFVDNVVVCLEPAEGSKVVAKNLTLSHECELHDAFVKHKNAEQFVYFFELGFGTVRFWYDWDYHFHWLHLGKVPKIDFSEWVDLFPFSLVYDYDDNGYVFNEDSVHNTTNWLFYPMKVVFKLNENQVGNNFHYNPKDTNTPVFYFELTNTSGQFLVRHEKHMSLLYRKPQHSKRVVFQAKPLGFVFHNRVFLIDTVRGCVYHFPLAALHLTSSFILPHQSMPLGRFLGCKPGSLGFDESECRPRLPPDVDWLFPVDKLPGQEKSITEAFMEMPYLYILGTIVLFGGLLLFLQFQQRQRTPIMQTSCSENGESTSESENFEVR